jgi:hypothetical protein
LVLDRWDVEGVQNNRVHVRLGQAAGAKQWLVRR